MEPEDEARLKGVVVGRSVWIDDGGSDISVVDVLGVGKGNLSRGVPTFGTDSRDEDAPMLGKFERGQREGDSLLEHVQLSLWEAYYLAVNREMLTLSRGDDHLSADAAWSEFKDADPDLPYKYSVYAWFRERGVVARSGLKLGVEFALYEESSIVQGHRHAFALAVVCGLPSQLIAGDTQPNWSRIHSAMRVAHSVEKKLILVQVSGSSSETSTSAESLNTLAIHTIVLSKCAM
ncbi:hypothetical protein NDN08_007141 [Rhodosorus marinus]|uniref:tRNA-intron lyase n=1 Tax=Rhodosorus marinus TaxID=101924 RepID=A0AAV8UFN7_9RHOD|nr:hypothetical protein NDN08_007141 [Rhodosorus marinus]